MITCEYFIPKKLNFQVSEVKRKLGIQCCAYGCKNKANYKKKNMCHKHYHIYRRIKDPVYNRFVNFRGNALRRGKEFTISLNEFREWCQKTGYVLQKGKRGKNCTIDRVKNELGYSINNIEIRSNLANIKKYHEHDKNHISCGPEEEECPF